MKILVYSERYGGNTTTFIQNEVKVLNKSHEVVVICLKNVNNSTNINIKKLDFKYSFRTYLKKKLEYRDIYLSFRNSSFSKNLNKFIADFTPDIIHCHFGYESLKVIDNIKNINSIPIFISFHGYDASTKLEYKVYVERLKKIFQNHNIYAICCSNYIMQKLINAGISLNDNNSTVINYGIETNLFQRTLRPLNKTKIFLQVSSFVEKKGHEYTLLAFKKLAEKNPNVKLILAGGGPLRQAMIELSETLGVSHLVSFPGWVTPEEARDLMNCSNFFLHHSVTSSLGDTEGLPNALIEAMAMEMPVISTYHAGIPELVEDNVNGYLIREKDIGTYIKRLEDILNWSFQARNRKKVEDRFSLEYHMFKLESMYKLSLEKQLIEEV